MGTAENLALVERLTKAKDTQDFETYAAGLAQDAVFMMAGVPEEFGGVLRGRDTIMAEWRRTKGMSHWETSGIFGDERQVCVTGKTTVERMAGTDKVKASERGYATDECVVYWIEDGLVVKITAYINWLSAYIQAGLLDLSTVMQ
jgi:ketosteroid isomerase-like protein